MKKTARKRTPNSPTRREYAFDYSKAKPNRFATKSKDTHVVVLDPDVAAVFTSSEAVNDLLRSAIAATRTAKPAKKSRTRSPRRAA